MRICDDHWEAYSSQGNIWLSNGFLILNLFPKELCLSLKMHYNNSLYADSQKDTSIYYSNFKTQLVLDEWERKEKWIKNDFLNVMSFCGSITNILPEGTLKTNEADMPCFFNKCSKSKMGKEVILAPLYWNVDISEYKWEPELFYGPGMEAVEVRRRLQIFTITEQGEEWRTRKTLLPRGLGFGTNPVIHRLKQQACPPPVLVPRVSLLRHPWA